MEKAKFGMIGLGTMGRNFLLNVAENGFSSVGYDLDAEKRKLLLAEGASFDIQTADDIRDFAAKIETPRKIMLLVPAGGIVDSVINELLPLLNKSDLIIDGGNSHFSDTERRQKLLTEKEINFLGVGVSGGEEGARNGASIMIGGDLAAYEQVEPILEAVSAKVNGEPCAAHVGAGSAGHFVKMVHNGIEYGLMQILAETYDFMRRVLCLSYEEMSRTFAVWNNSQLNSFLVEITSEVLRKVDADTGKPLVEMVLDKAAQKGTGKWTSQAAMDLGVPVPTIDAAVAMRQISALKELRVLAAKSYGAESPLDLRNLELAQAKTVHSEPLNAPKAERHRRDFETVASQQQKFQIDARIEPDGGNGEHPVETEKSEKLQKDFAEHKQEFVQRLENALINSFIVTYAQGLSLLQTASIEKNYNLDLAEIAKIWRGGCIIRSALLDEMRQAFTENPQLPNLILDERFKEILNEKRGDWRLMVGEFTESRVPALCLSSALAYFDALRTQRLPANLTQAQRDFFGAHTYQRIDREGVFHTPDW
ncbi:MAG TPA: NADP-dependent phosphogluconate dehydrogenase [Pyrinomonadaceae bacterium]|nr:NADP-dependent phosphogluconate dehydrogenase [Pyrinomonadaceae bacterium]